MIDHDNEGAEVAQKAGEAPAEDKRPLTPAAERALAEAQARRAAYDAFEAGMPAERGGRGGHDPVRYGDWEKKGIATDF
ncbi:DUF1674 domain-containing protein [Tianweitania sediminis]|uniref:DUF1674 domain-containing protein n=1 Tax=Tianweitania sediminis TaxID=1502156 RepID=A0A8J7UIB6_9HYPH|nr:DUF1674 domain-containing protein [Tianweitania sediminis]MBP0437625.1 DUF1674 domain-containing protein [Tianweitania sediminis]